MNSPDSLATVVRLKFCILFSQRFRLLHSYRIDRCGWLSLGGAVGACSNLDAVAETIAGAPFVTATRTAENPDESCSCRPVSHELRLIGEARAHRRATEVRFEATDRLADFASNRLP